MREPQTLHITFPNRVEAFKISNADLVDDLFEATSLLSGEGFPLSLEDSLKRGWDTAYQDLHKVLDTLPKIPTVLHVGVSALTEALRVVLDLKEKHPETAPAVIYSMGDSTIGCLVSAEISELESLWERPPELSLSHNKVAVIREGTRGYSKGYFDPPYVGPWHPKVKSPLISLPFKGGLIKESAPLELSGLKGIHFPTSEEHPGEDTDIEPSALFDEYTEEEKTMLGINQDQGGPAEGISEP